MSLLLQTSIIPRINIHLVHRTPAVKSLPLLVLSRKSDSDSEPDLKLNSAHKPKPKPKPRPRPRPRTRNRRQNTEPSQNDGEVPITIPRKPRRGRRSEAAAVEDYVRDTLERTFASIREQSAVVFENKGNVMKERAEDEGESESESESEISDDEEDGEVAGEKKKKKKKKKGMVVEEESQDWPLDADVGWGIRASEYFEKHPIKNVAGEDGVEIDWEGEIDDNWVKEINCLEWESFAFHPSPLVVLVFERYNRATDNWKTLKELEKAVKVYWDAKDRLPPRSVKIDINIERDLAYALKVKEGPQILFLRGNRILYREKEFRTADELVHMIAHFYYNAKRPSWIDVSALSRPYY